MDRMKNNKASFGPEEVHQYLQLMAYVEFSIETRRCLELCPLRS